MATATFTTTTGDDLVLAAFISELVLREADENEFMSMLCYREDVSGKESLVAKFPRMDALTAAAVAQGSDISMSNLTTTSVSVTAGEKGVAVAVAGLAKKVSPRKFDPTIVGAACGRALGRLRQTDGCAIFSSAATSVGSSGVDLTLANIESAIYTLKLAKAPVGNDTEPDLPLALKQVQAVLHTIQMSDLRVALRTAGGVSLLPAEQLGILLNSGRAPLGFAGELYGVSFWESTAVATANGGADRNGCMFVPAAFGYAYSDITIETERDASARADEVVVVQPYAFGVIATDYACGIVTDA